MLSDPQHLGLVMLAYVSRRERPNYYGMTDDQLYDEAHQLGQETAMLSEHVGDCRKALAEAEREYRWHADGLEWVEGILEVRKLNRRDMKNDQKNQ